MLPARFRFTLFAAVVLFVFLTSMSGQSPIGVTSAPSQACAQAEKKEPKNREASPSRTLFGRVEAFETSHLYTRIPGYVLDWKYDVGDRVKRDTLLVRLWAPEIEEHLNAKSALVKRAEARLDAKKARAEAAAAEVDAAKIVVDQSQLAVKSAASAVKLREAQFKRMKELFSQKAIDEGVLEESQARHAAAIDAEKAAKLAFLATGSKSKKTRATLTQSNADVQEAEADIRIAQVDWAVTKATLDYQNIKAPFDGVITERGCANGDFVRPLIDVINQKPLYVMMRTDIVRLAVSISEIDVPFVHPGDKVDVELAAYPGKKWSSTVTRTTGAIDPKTRTMRAEVYLSNPDGTFVPGMSATVTIHRSNRK